jgi:hypothetical protein
LGKGRKGCKSSCVLVQKSTRQYNATATLFTSE